ncbi:uncharacterized protein [Paramisgurnus dabryanus]|uniref:uncharacterized protein n=1 Tax=Paramisgurnus dabryanus TaxID=90735 RepID=UPI0031F37FDC
MANTDQLDNDNVFSVGVSSYGGEEVSHDGHINIQDLTIMIEENASQIRNDFLQINRNYNLRILDYLSKEIPDYPTPVEFHISEVTHVTNKHGFQEILNSEGFKAREYKDDTFSWWSLKINEENINEAEERYLEEMFPDRTQEQRENQETFLNKFTTSPAFDIQKSRYGNFRFTFPLNELMEAYKNQKCGVKDPVLRAYKTTFYKQEIMYVVLIHSPEDNEKFEKFPEIESSLLFDYNNDTIIWKAQAICENHEYQLLLDEENRIAETEHIINQFYVWDHVALAFHFNGVLHFPKEKLKESITCCEIDTINLSRSERLSLEEAEEIKHHYTSM